MTSTSLTDTLDTAWACMKAGAAPGKSRFSMVQLATIGSDGAPRARTVVIRSVDTTTRELAFHTDRRSPKIKELTADPRVNIIGYDMEAGQQVRIEGTARMHIGDSEALAAWGDSRADSRVCYQADHAPGVALDDPRLGDVKVVADPTGDQKIGFQHFCRVVIQVTKIDWLNLATQGHRRAIHVWEGDAWSSFWVAP